MSYVEESLSAGEIVHFETKLTRTFLWVFLLVSFVTLPVYGIGAIFFLVSLVYYLAIKTSEFAVTNKKVIIKYGILTITSVEIMFSKIESVSVNQSIAGRVFNYGQIIISGTGGTKQVFDMIDRPIEFRRNVMEAMEKYSK